MTSSIRNLLLIFVLFLLPASAADVPLVADAHTNSANPGGNFGTMTTVQVSAATAGFFKFDLSALPVGLTSAQVSKAYLVLFVNKVNSAGSIDLFRVTSTWDEATLSAGQNTGMVGLASNIPTTLSASYVTIEVTDLVKSWVEGTAINYGIALKPNSSYPTTNLYIDSKETTTTSHPARLEVQIANYGPQGIQGPAGPQGPQGVPGANGTNGTNGKDGATGPQGIQGPKGDTGSQGIQGPKGDTGSQGIQGPPGLTGYGHITASNTGSTTGEGQAVAAAEAKCPVGYKILGGSVQLTTIAGSAGYAIRESRVTWDGSQYGWRGVAMSVGGANGSVRTDVLAICAIAQ